jgi:hypothetical protein
MIYISFKDLVVKYIFVIVLAELLDFTLIERCFSYRLQTEISEYDKFSRLLYKPYFECYQEFNNWQLEQVESQNCMIKTDISSFYDSISHEYLISAIAKQINISIDDPFLIIFSKTLKFKICYYSILNDKLGETYNNQGIPIGDEAEGFIANLFLKEADEALYNLDINFGRYVDDFRIFAEDKKKAMDSLLILQEFLLKIGLNLNTSKTKVVEAKEQIKQIIKETKSSIFSLNFSDEEISNQTETVLDRQNLIDEIYSEEISLQNNSKVIDQQEETENFSTFEDVDDLDKAHKFCQFLNNIKLGEQKLDTNILNNYLEWTYKLSMIYPKYCKFYSWLFVKFIVHDYANEVQVIGLKYLFKILRDDNIHVYIKTRIIHHLINPRKGTLTYIERISITPQLRDKIIEEINNLIKISCIALQLNCIYAYYLIVKNNKKVKDLISKNLKRPIPVAKKNAIYQIDNLCFQQSVRLPIFDEILDKSISQYKYEPEKY